jgi:non-reducing end alpha-L-arabinofuranosidase
MAEPPLPRPQGPCDIYGAAGTPCVAAHSTTRALYASYNGPLYQVKRTSDSKTLDVGLTADGYANAAAQANRETAMVVSASGGRGGARITIAAPLSFAHAAGAEISGSGITVTTALTRSSACPDLPHWSVSISPACRHRHGSGSGVPVFCGPNRVPYERLTRSAS